MDWEKVSVLLDVLHKSANAGPAYNWFAGLAMEELKQIRRDAEPPVEAKTPDPSPGLFDRAKAKLGG